jgi:hypothetical protein
MRLALSCAVLALFCASAWAAEPDWLSQPTLKPQRKQAPEAKPAGPEDAKKSQGPNLLADGAFERSTAEKPVGWGPIDLLTTTIVRGGPSGKGACLRIDTDVYLNEWEENNRARAAGRPGITAKTPTSGPKYDTVAGTHGVHVYSDPIRVKPDGSYMLSLAIRGPSAKTFFPKVFVKGYRDVEGEEREVWRAPLHCRTDPKEWKTFTWESPKAPGKGGAQRVKVILYCYWPPGVYEIDDVRFWPVAKQDRAGRSLSPGAQGRTTPGAANTEEQ